jgi:hypothetical protein
MFIDQTTRGMFKNKAAKVTVSVKNQVCSRLGDGGTPGTPAAPRMVERVSLL